MAKLFVTLSREEAEVAAPVEPIDAGKAAELAEQTSEVEADVKETEELEDGIQEGLESLEDLQEAENMAAASAGEEPVDVVTGEPVVEAEDAEGCSETPGVTEPTPTGTEEAVAAPAPEVAAAVATECLRQVKKRLGAPSAGIQVSFEGLESNSPLTQLNLAREGIGDFAKKVWDGIVAFFRKLMEKIKELWSKFMGLFSKQAEVTKQLVEEAEVMEKEEPGLFSNLEFPDEVKEKIAQKLTICITDNTDPIKNIEALKNLIVGRQKAVIDAYRKIAERFVKKANKNGSELSEDKKAKIGEEEIYNLFLGLAQATGTENIKPEFLPSIAKKYDLKSVYIANPFTGAAYSIGYEHKKGEETKENLKHFKLAKFTMDGFKNTSIIARFAANIKPLDVAGQKKVAEIQEQIEKKYGPDLDKTTSDFSKKIKDAVEALQSKQEKKTAAKASQVEEVMKGLQDDLLKEDLGELKNVLMPIGASVVDWCSWYSMYTSAVGYYVNASVTAAKKKKGRKAKNYNDDGTFKETKDDKSDNS